MLLKESSMQLPISPLLWKVGTMGHLIHDGSVGARAEQMQGLSSHSAMCRLIPAMEPRISRGLTHGQGRQKVNYY